MVGGGNRKDDLAISNSNVFAALGTLRKKKKPSDKDSKSKSSSAGSSSAKKEEQKEPEPQVFWAPAPLTAKSWADVDDEDDDDYYATTAPPQSVWGASGGEAEHQPQHKESSTPVEESESEEEGLDELDDDNEDEHEHEPETPVKEEPVITKPAEVVANKEAERQLSKKELKKKELAELEAMLAQFGYSKADDQDTSQGVPQDKKLENADNDVNKRESNAPGESRSAKKKKKKDKSSKESKEQQDQPNGTEVVDGTEETVGIDDADGATIDVKEKMKKVASMKKKKSSKEMDAAARAAASEAAARSAKLAAAKKKEKNHYNQQPQRSNSTQVNLPPTMEENKRLEFDFADTDNLYAKELEVAVKAVHLACLLCEKVQDDLISKGLGQVHSKHDNSPVTVADWSVQATVSWVLSEAFGRDNVSIVAEEDVEVLSKAGSSNLLEDVVKTVNECLTNAPLLGLKATKIALGAEEVLAAISQCNSIGSQSGRFWVLDPVDGTLGFVRGDQYAIALALIEDGKPVIGVLGCPNYPIKKEWLNYHNGYHRILSRLSSPTAEPWGKGCVLYAKKGSGRAWMQPLLHGEEKFVWPNFARQIKVSSMENPALATFCEPVEKANSSHSFSAGLAHSVGLRNQPLHVYSMVKYAAIARGDAEIFMKFARAGYKEKIWDHAAGVIIIEEAGGVVTDAGGKPLDFSKGIYLEGLDRGIIACSGAVLHEKIMNAVDASWNSSNL